MTRGRPKTNPSLRNLQLYHEVVCAHRPQAKVAAEFHVSPPRAVTIANQVKDWIDDLLPSDLHVPAQIAGDPVFRFHLALAYRRYQLTKAYEEYLSAFGGQRNAANLAPVVALWKEGNLAKQLSDLLPSLHLVESAVQMAQELDGLARLAQRSPFFESPDRLLQRQQQAASLAPDTATAPQPDGPTVVLPASNSAVPSAVLTPNP